MLEGLRISLEGFSAWIRTRAGKANADTKGKGLANPSADLRLSQSTKRKHPAAGDEEEAEDSQDEGQQGKKPRLKSSEADDDDGPFLACPFYKRNPVCYSRCLCFRLKRITDVKQHLKRKHEQPHYCAFCGEQFESQAALKSHERDRSCTRADFEEPEGVSEDQRKRLAFKVSRKKTEDEQWHEIWVIIFPNTERPDSAYVGHPELEVLSSFQAYWEEWGEDVVTEHLQQTLPGTAVLTEQDDIKEMMRVLLHESMGTLLDRFTQRYFRTLSSVPDAGTASTATSNPVQSEKTGTSTSRRFRFLKTLVSGSRKKPAPAAKVPHDLHLQQKHGSPMGATPFPVHSPSRALANPTTTIDYSEVQGDLPEWNTAFPDILSDSDTQLFDTWMENLVNQETSITE